MHRPDNLTNDFLRLTVDPDHGASMNAFAVQKAGRWLALTPEARPGFLMIPYSNRIEHGRFTFAGQSYQLANGENHAIHGDARGRPWMVLEADATHLCCGLSTVACPDRNWPWPYEARVEYHLVGDTLRSRLVLWNRGETAMPAGFGWHPFYNRALTRPGEPVFLRMAAQCVYPDAHGNRIPSGPPGPIPAALDFSQARPLEPDHFLDTCFAGYDGAGHIEWPESGVRLGFRCTPACTHLVIYNPRAQPFFAIEPVTNANNGVNLYGRDEMRSGIVRLLPGETLAAEFAQQVVCM